MKQIKISVRNLVEFIFREGDIETGQGISFFQSAMREGSNMHRKIQARAGSHYRSEVPLKIEVDISDAILLVEGRADGIIEKDGMTTIDEIKTGYGNIEDIEEAYYVHQAQAMCYGYIYAKENMLSNITIQLTYCHLETELIKQFHVDYTFDELEKWFEELIEAYAKWVRFELEHKRMRNRSIKSLEFPYAYRKGQKDMAASVYVAIKQRKNLFVQAPTGIGKTMATVFPAVKALGENLGDKIFYLTAKTITKTVAAHAFLHLREKGLCFKDIVLTAKEKICPLEEMNCNPLVCPYAKGHYDRVNDAIYDVITQEMNITREVVLQYANTHMVCPYEFSLDVSLFVDGIICDYNYAFDPRAQLKRYFGQGVRGDYIFLIDEAHNLVERARSMYSAELYKEDFLKVKRYVMHHDKKLATLLEACNQELLQKKKLCRDYELQDDIGGFYLKILKLHGYLESFLPELKHFSEKQTKEILEFYFAVNAFFNTYELADESYIFYTRHMEDQRFMLKLYCVHPANNLVKCLQKGSATIFFSATFLPIQYYKELLSNQEEDYAIYVPSPFQTEKRLLAIGKDISTKYRMRGNKQYEQILRYLTALIQAKRGNYMVFFPSYEMLEQVYKLSLHSVLKDEARILIQQSNMKEEERENFIKYFQVTNNPEKSLLGFCVLGGIFSEGIDLTNDSLIGAVIVGTGIPMLTEERKILCDYFKEAKGTGFGYAYIYPGMNKVLQAAGRVIRTDADKGIILLLDARFVERETVELFPMEWADYEITNVEEFSKKAKEFWEENK